MDMYEQFEQKWGAEWKKLDEVFEKPLPANGLKARNMLRAIGCLEILREGMKTGLLIPVDCQRSRTTPGKIDFRVWNDGERDHFLCWSSLKAFRRTRGPEGQCLFIPVQVMDEYIRECRVPCGIAIHGPGDRDVTFFTSELWKRNMSIPDQETQRAKRNKKPRRSNGSRGKSGRKDN